MVLESSIRIVINDDLWFIFTFYSFISVNIRLGRVIFDQNLKAWVKCTHAMIYKLFTKSAYN